MFSCCSLADSQMLVPLNAAERALSFRDSSGCPVDSPGC